MRLKQKTFRRKIFLKAIIFTLFQKIPKTDGNILDKVKEKDETADSSKIRCPLCRWQPRASSRWFCADAGFPEYYFDGCGTMWNTFATRGVCPDCAHRWQWTTCLACHKMSRHKDWYAKKDD